MIKKLETSKENILEYELSDEISKPENDMILREIKQVINAYGKVNLLVRLVNVPKVDLTTLNDRFDFVKQYMDDIDKCAVITDSRVISLVEKVVDTFTELEFKTFSYEEEHEARSWIH